MDLASLAHVLVDDLALGMIVSLRGGVMFVLAKGCVVGYGWDFSPVDDDRAWTSGIWYGDFKVADVGAEFSREGVARGFVDVAGSSAMPEWSRSLFAQTWPPLLPESLVRRCGVA